LWAPYNREMRIRIVLRYLPVNILSHQHLTCYSWFDDILQGKMHLILGRPALVTKFLLITQKAQICNKRYSTVVVYFHWMIAPQR
jgi:hypothetical protein